MPQKKLEPPSIQKDTQLHGLDTLKQEITQKLVPAELDETLRATTASVTSQIDILRRGLAGFDSTLAAALDTSRAKILYQLSKIERKAARESLRRNERASAEAAYLCGLIYPNKHLQERFYTVLPFLAKHGLAFIDRLYENVHLGCPDHTVIAG